MQKYSLKRDPYSSHSYITREISRYHPNTILDIGSNTGLISQALGEGWRKKIWAVEVDSKAARIAQKYYRKVWVKDIEQSLPPKRNFFDCLVFGDVLEHLKNPSRALAQCVNQLLKKNGLVLISLPNVVNWYVRIQLVLGNFSYQERGLMDHTHLRFFTWKSAQKLILDSGLIILHRQVSPIPLPLVWEMTDIGKPLFFVHQLNNAVTNLRPGLLGYQLLYICKKK